MIRIVISTADVRNAVKANVTISVSRDAELTPVLTRAWVRIILYLLVYVSQLTYTCIRRMTEYWSTGPENERSSKWQLHGIIRNQRTEMRLWHNTMKSYLGLCERCTHPFNGPLSGTTRVGRYQKGKTNVDFTEARDNEWQWHQLGHIQVCTSLQTDNHASTPPLSFLHARCPSCRPTNSVKALKRYEHKSADNGWRVVDALIASDACCRVWSELSLSQRMFGARQMWQIL